MQSKSHSSQNEPLPETSKARVPEGIEEIAMTHYRVGPYTYGRLSEAVAELKRRTTRTEV